MNLELGPVLCLKQSMHIFIHNIAGRKRLLYVLIALL